MTAVYWRRSRVISPVEFTRTRFGIGTQQLLTIIFSIIFLASAGGQLLAISKVVNGLLTVPIFEAIIVIGIIVIIYTFLGGLWAVMVTDVLQFVILISVTLLVVPLAVLLLDGGLSEMFSNMSFTIPPKYGAPFQNFHFLMAALLSGTMGIASGQGPRFYCVPEEKSARKVGMLAAILFLTTPVLFSIPSLVARSYWGTPDMLGSVIAGENPHELVFIQIVKEVLPPGLIGVFLAAMFAATMSALDSYYNQVASMLSRDVYMTFKPKTSDKALLGIGKIMTFICGTIVVGLALFYMKGGSDLFTILTTIFYLAAPATAVPIVLGFFYRRAPKFAGIASIVWGIVIGFVTNLALKWHIGPQTYISLGLCMSIFIASPLLGDLWRKKDGKISVIIISFLFSAFVSGMLLLGSPENFLITIKLGKLEWYTGVSSNLLIFIIAIFLWVSSVYFSKKFGEEDTKKEELADFFKKLDTPVDVKAEVTGKSKAAVEVFRLVGILTYVITALVFIFMLIEQWIVVPKAGAEPVKYIILILILGVMGSFFYFSARKFQKIADEEEKVTEPIDEPYKQAEENVIDKSETNIDKTNNIESNIDTPENFDNNET